MRFNDIDMLGHLNNSVYFTFMDLAKARYFQAVLGDKFRWGNIGVVIVNVNCDFCAPSFFDDELEVETAVISIGDKSLTLEPHHHVGLRCQDHDLGAHHRRVARGPEAI